MRYVVEVVVVQVESPRYVVRIFLCDTRFI